MGLSWQQGPLSPGAIGRFLVPEQLPRTSVTHVGSYREAYSEVSRISDLVSFEPDMVSVQLDGVQLRLEPGQTMIPHGPDRGLTVAESLPHTNNPERAPGGGLATGASGEKKIRDGRAAVPHQSGA